MTTVRVITWPSPLPETKCQTCKDWQIIVTPDGRMVACPSCKVPKAPST